MLVLSLPHPYAFGAIALAMDVVPLYYKTTIRGPVLVHAPRMSIPRDERTPTEFAQDWKFILDGWYEKWGIDPPYKTSYRRLAEISDGILGMLEIVDCVKEHDSPWMPERGYGLVVRDSRPLPFTKCPGIAGLWECQPKIEKALGLAP